MHGAVCRAGARGPPVRRLSGPPVASPGRFRDLLFCDPLQSAHKSLLFLSLSSVLDDVTPVAVPTTGLLFSTRVHPNELSKYDHNFGFPWHAPAGARHLPLAAAIPRGLLSELPSRRLETAPKSNPRRLESRGPPTRRTVPVPPMRASRTRVQAPYGTRSLSSPVFQVPQPMVCSVCS